MFLNFALSFLLQLLLHFFLQLPLTTLVTTQATTQATTQVAPPPTPQASQQIIVGADRLFTDYFHLIKGKRIGLISNHSGRLADGTHLADAIHAHPELTLQVLFGMEYNIRSNDYSIARDPEVSLDAQTGVPKYSLYGQHHKPSPASLEQVEVLLYDIQEVGARFYEHVNILGFTMEAAADAGIPIIVLDRPNPVSGLHVEGFVADSAQFYTFGSYTAIPILHGMTVGELARMYNSEGLLRQGVKADLTVIPMLNWNRSLWYDQTGLAWRKPSPNLYNLESVLAYLGTCLFEAYNVSEGRGTDHPFEWIGAPFVDAPTLARVMNAHQLQGVSFQPIQFTPQLMPHLSREPELSGQVCQGVELVVTDRTRFEPYKTGIALLWSMHELYGDHLEVREDVLLRLSGTPRLLTMLRNRTPLDELLASWKQEVETFKQKRLKYLMYE